ncbi:proteophosphoglycan 5 [Pseudonocardia humida]|uniref:Proteophosphoglycan 5 n=1 Tax=Pseudonocardia humida TaxID=2800819 RepID=A0ABT0ZW79_9PSEU|nr:proteophosphoglycan 5 [Pseudonocardia humida]MCO1654991.1 proteophosphoglycan 5 [Pseudonocardia humida]
MALVTLDLPRPDEMRGRWAAFAAVCAARGWSDSCRAEGGRWHYDDGGGNFADLVHVGAGRAVLIGNDHEYSDTYFATAAEYFGEEETDLLAGAPDWWAPPARAAMDRGEWIGFVYGFDGTTWRRAAYDKQDGFASVALPAVDERRCRELIEEFTQDAPGLAGPPSPDAVAALIAADGDVTPDLLGRVVGTGGWDLTAGAAAARAFR